MLQASKKALQGSSYWILLACTLLTTGGLHAAPKAELWAYWDAAGTESNAIDHSAWQGILDKYLIDDHDSGINRFNYAKVSGADREVLESYLSGLQAIDPRKASRDVQMAYWINLYNAATVALILDNYPVKSITKLGKGFFAFGPWDDELLRVNGKALSLNDIEHRILRPIWKDARIHFVVNCASLGCPDLSASAFTAGTLEVQLQASAERYLAHPRGARVEGKTLYLSKIFDWYQDDFGGNEKAMLNALSKYAPESKAAGIREHTGRIKYEYDWDLNSP